LVVICPKCKTKLKVAEEKIAPGGSRFKCPKCSAALLLKKPLPAPARPAGGMTILVAHSNPAIANEIVSLLKNKGYGTMTASDGIEAMVKALKAIPSIAIVEVGLPKIYGFEVCKRLKLRAETKSMKFILVNSVHDKTRYKREPESFYGADDYIEEHLISTLLIESIDALMRKEPVEKKEEISEKPSGPLSKETLAPKEEPLPQLEKKKIQPSSEEKIERARRLARTIVSDIYLYNTAKADEAIRNNTFQPVFAPEIKEGLKLYEGRIAREVRAQGDFFQEALINFIEGKKKTL
jgi:predicted Zn finger-like uncharacterized protein